MCSTGGSVRPLLLLTTTENVMDQAADGILTHGLTEPAPPLIAISIRALGFIGGTLVIVFYGEA